MNFWLMASENLKRLSISLLTLVPSHWILRLERQGYDKNSKATRLRDNEQIHCLTQVLFTGMTCFSLNYEGRRSGRGRV